MPLHRSALEAPFSSTKVTPELVSETRVRRSRRHLTDPPFVPQCHALGAIWARMCPDTFRVRVDDHDLFRRTSRARSRAYRARQKRQEFSQLTHFRPVVRGGTQTSGKRQNARPIPLL